ncbi:hypothetical protein SAMN05421579_13026 [Xenorhabdus japonica]|uniref:Uncharacterized protein n=1 Tax=Xenorhabdus japonica TaxID=53341 RepID=A0A1I5CTI6_9GAMM|nr:hypothetical protein SAMN05421579_13026 [Xenorhabdus japonica]
MRLITNNESVTLSRKSAAAFIGIDVLRSLLGQRTKSKLRSCTTEERPNYGA